MVGYTGQFQLNATVREYLQAVKTGDRTLAKKIERSNPTLAGVFEYAHTRVGKRRILAVSIDTLVQFI